MAATKGESLLLSPLFVAPAARPSLLDSPPSLLTRPLAVEEPAPPAREPAPVWGCDTSAGSRCFQCSSTLAPPPLSMRTISSPSRGELSSDVCGMGGGK